MLNLAVPLTPHRLDAEELPPFTYAPLIFFLFSGGMLLKMFSLLQTDGKEDGEQFKSVLHWDMKSKAGAGAASRLMNEVSVWGLRECRLRTTVMKADGVTNSRESQLAFLLSTAPLQLPLGDPHQPFLRAPSCTSSSSTLLPALFQSQGFCPQEQ